MSGSQNGVPLVGSALVLPGSPHPTNRSLGKAPWLFGANQIDVSDRKQLIFTNATALFRAEAATRPELTRELTLAIDLNDGASAVVGTPEGSRLALNLMGMSVPESAFVRPRFAEVIQKDAQRPDTCLRIHLENGRSPEEGLHEAEEQRDVVACRVVDELLEQLSTFIASLCRMLRPANVIVSSWLISALGKSEEVERLVRRRCPAVAADAMKFHYCAPNESTHLIGGALSAIDEWLLSLES